MELGLKGKVALIGGASKGLGKACALGLVGTSPLNPLSARGEGRGIGRISCSTRISMLLGLLSWN